MQGVQGQWLRGGEVQGEIRGVSGQRTIEAVLQGGMSLCQWLRFPVARAHTRFLSARAKKWRKIACRTSEGARGRAEGELPWHPK